MTNNSRNGVTLTAPEDIAFVNALSGEDDLGVVIRVAIWTENILVRLVEQPLPAPKELEKLNLDYHGRISLAVALGMPADMAPALRALGSLRNRFAHRLDMKLTTADVANIFNALPAQRRSYIQDFLNQMHKEGVTARAKYSLLSAQDQFKLIAMSLRSFLLGGLDEQAALLKARQPGQPVSGD